jgi:hypothetical protein
MRTLTDDRPLINAERVFLDYRQTLGKGGAQFRQRRQAAAIALDRDDRRTGFQQGSSEAAWTWPDLGDGRAQQWSGDGSDTRQQLAVEDEVLAERLGCVETMAGDDLA